MSEQEKRNFYIAMCKCCLIAETMKTCPLCRFKIGLAKHPTPVSPVPDPAQLAGLSMQA